MLAELTNQELTSTDGISLPSGITRQSNAAEETFISIF